MTVGLIGCGFLLALAAHFSQVRSAVECPLNLKLLCNEQTNCNECIRIHPCCHWCYDQQNFTGSRCNFIEELKQCDGQVEKNVESKLEIETDKDFTAIRKTSDVTRVIQIKPQGFKVVLRKDAPINFTFTYNAAKNYPLELYYLGDLSYSMRTHLETLKNLGDDLGKSLENLTLNYKLAYGSFLDKPALPFFYTDEKNMNNPCMSESQKCERGYLFRHRLNFTKNTGRFFDKVKNSQISANVDDLDGALEAISQILVCNKKFGWTENSRKLIVLSTDSLLHTAGDGLLAGAVKKNDDVCLIDYHGNYMDPLRYDYPSVGQIRRLLKDYKVNLIIAVTKDKIKFYEQMKTHILNDEVYVGELEENSANILKLVNTGFYNFMRQVQFSANTSHAPELDVKFFGNCDGFGHFNQTSACYNVEEETPVTFKVQITLKEFTSKKVEQIFIKEKNINEELTVNIEYAGCDCTCENYQARDILNCGPNGVLSCGSCLCSEGWTGPTCSEECSYNVTLCRNIKSANKLTCSGAGDCLCGKCECDFPHSGKFCEFYCPVDKRNRICSGHGTCFEGECTCDAAYSGKDCSCETGVENCKLTGRDYICNGHGACECNSCQCDEGFEGAYCEKNKEKNFFCDIYSDYVKEFKENGTSLFRRNNVEVLVEGLRETSNDGDGECSLVYFPGATRRCRIDYRYVSGQNNSIHLHVTSEECVMTNTATATFFALAAFMGVVLLGLIFIAFKKFQIYRMDQAEYKRFITEKKSVSEMNPLYKSPVSTFTNPMARSQ
ncbi:integrin beta-nu-like [Cylas formicarius]|uniref:integrin beta-nu-like n=1 Tax=Cylas formicarius TaxID=197179 RepID=UPI00295872E9|nr:integrin beta-nu-like [Cylas formicarius]